MKPFQFIAPPIAKAIVLPGRTLVWTWVEPRAGIQDAVPVSVFHRLRMSGQSTAQSAVSLGRYAPSVPDQRAHHDDRLAINKMPRPFAHPRQPDAVWWSIRLWNFLAIVSHFF